MTTSKTFSVPTVTEMQQLVSFCQVLASAPFYQKMGPGGVLAIYLTAKEMNLPLMLCLNGGLYTYDGKVSLSAQLMQVMIVNAGGRVEIVHLDREKCHLRFFWKNKNYEYTYTIKDAADANYLKKDNWKHHPKDMLYARTLSGGARKYLPEVIMNAYVFGELDHDDRAIEPIFDTPAIENQQEVKLLDIEEMPVDGYHEYVALHNIVEGTDIYEYVKKVMEASGKSQVSIINAAIKNPDRFSLGLQQWMANVPQTVNHEAVV
jgi:hypothetical protein